MALYPPHHDRIDSGSRLRQEREARARVIHGPFFADDVARGHDLDILQHGEPPSLRLTVAVKCVDQFPQHDIFRALARLGIGDEILEGIALDFHPELVIKFFLSHAWHAAMESQPENKENFFVDEQGYQGLPRFHE